MDAYGKMLFLNIIRYLVIFNGMTFLICQTFVKISDVLFARHDLAQLNYDVRYNIKNIPT